MRLALQIVDPKFDSQGNLRALGLSVTVISDPSARCDIAKIVPHPETAPEQCKIDRYFLDLSSFRR
jgi:hypothetical protein